MRTTPVMVTRMMRLLAARRLDNRFDAWYTDMEPLGSKARALVPSIQ